MNTERIRKRAKVLNTRSKFISYAIETSSDYKMCKRLYERLLGISGEIKGMAFVIENLK